MSVKDFFLKELSVNLEDTTSIDAKMIKDNCAFSGITCPLDKDVSNLSDDEIGSLMYLPYRYEKSISLNIPVCTRDVKEWGKQKLNIN